MVPLQTVTAGTAACSVQNYVAQCRAAHGRHAAGLGRVSHAGPKAVAAAAGGGQTDLASRGIVAACLPSYHHQRSWLVVTAANAAAAAVVAEPCLEQQPVQQQCPDEVDTYSLLHQLHHLCDDSVGLAAPAQLHAWSASVQPHLASMALAELAYVACCLRHHHYMWQQQDQQQQSPYRGFVASPGFMQEACAAACAAATAVQQELQQTYSLQQDAQAQDQTAHQPGAAAPHHQELVACLHQLLDLLQWGCADVVQQRQLLQQQLLQVQQAQQQRQGPELDPASPAVLQAYRQQLQLQVEAQQQVHQLLQHPLLLQALPHASCWQLQQLLVCYGHLGQVPRFDWMGHWLAAARHAMSDLVLAYQHQDWHLQHQHGPNWQQHVYEHRAAAAAAYTQLVGLLWGLAAAHVKPQDAWMSTWQQAAKAVLAAQPCFSALEQHDGSTGGSSDSSSSLFSMLQQLLQSVSTMELRLSADFWAAHEGAQGLPGKANETDCELLCGSVLLCFRQVHAVTLRVLCSCVWQYAE